jgi:hypothetical protein
MTNVQRRDLAPPVCRMTPLETRAGQPSQRQEHSCIALTQHARLKPSMVPHRPFAGGADSWN